MFTNLGILNAEHCRVRGTYLVKLD